MRDRRRRAATAFLVSCEHGGRRIPARWRALFASADEVLASHRGWDPGAATLATTLARELQAPCLIAYTTRLLVDLNRSPGHPRLFSEYTRPLPERARAAILAAHYLPHRQHVTCEIDALLARHERVIHVAAHSFTPVLDGRVREADAGLLYDPARTPERSLAERWQRALAAAAPSLKVRRNYPYRGRDDGLTTWLRRHHSPDRYLGLELELNQRITAAPPREWLALRRTLAHTLREAAAGLQP